MSAKKTIIITATEPRGSALASKYNRGSIECHALPLLTVKRLVARPIIPPETDAVIVTSMHALAGLTPQAIPLYAVGAHTAAAARACGWVDVTDGGGTVAALVTHLRMRTYRNIFYPCAHDRAPLTDTCLATLPATITTTVTYQTERHNDFAQAFGLIAKNPYLITIHSARAGALFSSLVHTYGWQEHVKAGVCLSLSQSVLESLRTVPFGDIGMCADASEMQLHTSIDLWACRGTVRRD